MAGVRHRAGLPLVLLGLLSRASLNARPREPDVGGKIRKGLLGAASSVIGLAHRRGADKRVEAAWSRRRRNG